MTSPCFGNLCWLLPVTASPLFGHVPSVLQSQEEHLQTLYIVCSKRFYNYVLILSITSVEARWIFAPALIRRSTISV